MMNNTELYLSFVRCGDPNLPKDFTGFLNFIVEQDEESLIIDIMWEDHYGITSSDYVKT